MRQPASACVQPSLLPPPALPASEADVDWSTYQRDIFRFAADDRRNGLIVARAGSGKTRTLVELIRHLPSRGTPLFCAFNAIIARELKRRCPTIEARTMHSMGFAALRRHWPTGGLHPDATRDRRIVEQCVPAWVDKQHRTDVLSLVRMAKAHLAWTDAELESVCVQFGIFIPWETYRKDGILPPGARDSELYRWVRGCLEAACRPEPGVSYDDMIYVPVRCRMQVATAGALLVDEAQDLTPAQIAMLRLMMAPDGRMIAVGDDRQSVYGWRGADRHSLPNIQRAFDTQVLSLPVTYRCARSIVDLARCVVPDFEPAPWAIQGLVRRTGVGRMIEELEPGDMVVSRVNAPLVRMCLQVLITGRRAYIQGRDLGAGLLRLVKQSEARSIAEFQRWLGTWQGNEVVRLCAKGEESEVEGVQDKVLTLDCLCEGLRTTEQLRNRIRALFSDDEPARVRFSSTHRAKGLEADRVYMLGWTYSHTSVEETNLWYVAVTRARNELVIVYADGKEE
jgi:DNA helicase-2/ATP-dependent DNA helicase PcrA